MGYQRPILRLTFDKSMGDLAGLEVTCKRMAIDHVKSLSSLRSATSDLTDEQTMERLDLAISILADHLIGWNLEDENGIPVAPTVSELRRQDMAFIWGVIGHWMDNAIGVSIPLQTPSEDGDQFPEGLIPMTEVPSPALSN